MLGTLAIGQYAPPLYLALVSLFAEKLLGVTDFVCHTPAAQVCVCAGIVSDTLLQAKTLCILIGKVNGCHFPAANGKRFT